MKLSAQYFFASQLCLIILMQHSLNCLSQFEFGVGRGCGISKEIKTITDPEAPLVECAVKTFYTYPDVRKDKGKTELFNSKKKPF